MTHSFSLLSLPLVQYSPPCQLINLSTRQPPYSPLTNSSLIIYHSSLLPTFVAYGKKSSGALCAIANRRIAFRWCSHRVVQLFICQSATRSIVLSTNAFLRIVLFTAFCAMEFVVHCTIITVRIRFFSFIFRLLK